MKDSTIFLIGSIVSFLAGILCIMQQKVYGSVFFMMLSIVSFGYGLKISIKKKH